jgi:hypothetical protein
LTLARLPSADDDAVVVVALGRSAPAVDDGDGVQGRASTDAEMRLAMGPSRGLLSKIGRVTFNTHHTSSSTNVLSKERFYGLDHRLEGFKALRG